MVTGRSVASYVVYVHRICLITDEHIKKLLPLGFTRKAIRRELFLSNGDLNTAASKLLDQHQEEGSAPLPSEGWEEVDAASSDYLFESQMEEKKLFSVGSIEVCTDGQFI